MKQKELERDVLALIMASTGNDSPTGKSVPLTEPFAKRLTPSEFEKVRTAVQSAYHFKPSITIHCTPKMLSSLILQKISPEGMGQEHCAKTLFANFQKSFQLVNAA